MAQVVILDFSGVYGRMRFWEHENAVWLDFKNLEGTNCYCDDEAAETITEQMRKLGAEGIHFLDSGNYHYATKLWTDQIRCPSTCWCWTITRICSSRPSEAFCPAADG